MNNKLFFNLKKIVLFIISIAILAVFIYVFMTYRYINNSKVKDKEAIIHFVKEATEIDHITGTDYFSWENRYDIIYGIDDNDKQYIVYNPSGNRNDDNLTIIEQEPRQLKEKIEKNWQSTCDGCTLKKSAPAMIEDKALWELTYIDKDKRYTMEYIDITDGSTIEKLKLNKKYR